MQDPISEAIERAKQDEIARAIAEAKSRETPRFEGTAPVATPQDAVPQTYGLTARGKAEISPQPFYEKAFLVNPISGAMQGAGAALGFGGEIQEEVIDALPLSDEDKAFLKGLSPSFLKGAGEALREGAPEPEAPDTFLGQVATASGSVIPAIALGVATGPVGPLAQFGAMAAYSFASEGGAEFYNSLAEDPENREDAWFKAIGAGSFAAVTEGVPMLPVVRRYASVLARVDKQSGGALSENFFRAMSEPGQEFAQEGGMSLWVDTLDKYLEEDDLSILEAFVETSTDPEALKRAAEQGVVGMAAMGPHVIASQVLARRAESELAAKQDSEGQQQPSGQESGSQAVQEKGFLLPEEERMSPAAQAAVEQAEMDPVAQRKEAMVRISGLNLDEMRAELARLEASERQLVSGILGEENAERWLVAERLGRTRELDRLEEGLSDADLDRLAGIGDPEPARSDVSSLIEAVEAAEAETGSQEDVIREASRLTRRMGGRRDPGEMGPSELEAYAAMKHLMRMASLEGYDMEAVGQGVARAIASRYSDPEDAMFMLRSLMPELSPQEGGASPEVAGAQPDLLEAAPESASEADPEPTSIRNETVDAELQAMGLPPATHGEKITFQEANEAAAKAMEADPFAGQKLVSELAESPRPIGPEEDALLLRERNRLRNERARVQNELAQAVQEGVIERVEQLQLEAQQIQESYVTASDVDTKVGTLNAQGLALRRMMMKADYSLAEMERTLQSAKLGQALTQEETSLLTELSQRIDSLEQELAKVRTEAKSPRPRKKLRKRAVSALTAEADKARARIAERGTRMYSTFDPKEFADEIIIAAEKIAKGLDSFADWSEQMVKEFGEGIRPHLPDVWVESEAKVAEADRTDRGIKEASVPAERSEPTKEEIKILTDIEEAKGRYHQRVDKARRESASKLDKLKAAGAEIIDLPRAMRSGWDFSAVLRQGMFFIFHGGKSAKAFGSMLRSAVSERTAMETDTALRNRPMAAIGERAGLELTRFGDKLGPHEEAIRSRFSDWIPGKKGSDRAFTTFLNVQRAQMFDYLVRSHRAKFGEPTQAELENYAQFVNIGTGRGDPARYAAYMPFLSKVLWSPRLLLSRFQLITGKSLRNRKTATANTRKLVAREYVRFMAGMSIIYLTAKMLGFDLEEDPRSSDFGKIRISDKTRIDPLAGLSQVAVFMVREYKGEKVTGNGKVRSMRFPEADGPFDELRSDVAWRFAKTKASPIIGVLMSAGDGQNLIGDEVTPLTLARDSLIPLAAQDITEAIQEEGLAEGLGLALLPIFGAGLQVYEQERARR